MKDEAIQKDLFRLIQVFAKSLLASGASSEETINAPTFAVRPTSKQSWRVTLSSRAVVIGLKTQRKPNNLSMITHQYERMYEQRDIIKHYCYLFMPGRFPQK